MKSRTTLELDQAVLAEAMELSGTKSKTETVELALRDLVCRRQRELLIQELGTYDLAYGVDELLEIRRMDRME